MIASDLPVHCEAGASFVTYISPTDNRGWLAAIENILQGDSHSRLEDFRPMTSTAYFTAVEEFLRTIAHDRRSA